MTPTDPNIPAPKILRKGAGMFGSVGVCWRVACLSKADGAESEGEQADVVESSEGEQVDVVESQAEKADVVESEGEKKDLAESEAEKADVVESEGEKADVVESEGLKSNRAESADRVVASVEHGESFFMDGFDSLLADVGRGGLDDVVALPPAAELQEPSASHINPLGGQGI